jgi:DNA-binding transcriptional LysR family regulator
VITYLLPDVLRQFQALFPHVHLTVTACSDSRAQIEEVLAGKLDLAIIVGEPLHSEQLTTSCLGIEEILIVKAPEYEYSAADPFSWEDFAKARVILTDRTFVFRSLFERVLEAAQVSLTDTMELGTIEAAKRCAMADMGLAVLPKMALTAELKDKRLVSVPWPGPGFSIYLQVIRHRERWASPALHALWGIAEQQLAKSG